MSVCVCLHVEVGVPGRWRAVVLALTAPHLAISDVFAVYLEELLRESLLLLGGGRHHSGLAQRWEHGRVHAVLFGRAIGVLEVGRGRVKNGEEEENSLELRSRQACLKMSTEQESQFTWRYVVQLKLSDFIKQRQQRLSCLGAHTHTHTH